MEIIVASTVRSVNWQHFNPHQRQAQQQPLVFLCVRVLLLLSLHLFVQLDTFYSILSNGDNILGIIFSRVTLSGHPEMSSINTSIGSGGMLRYLEVSIDGMMCIENCAQVQHYIYFHNRIIRLLISCCIIELN